MGIGSWLQNLAAIYENDLSTELLTLGGPKREHYFWCYMSGVPGPWKCPPLGREVHFHGPVYAC